MHDGVPLESQEDMGLGAGAGGASGGRLCAALLVLAGREPLSISCFECF